MASGKIEPETLIGEHSKVLIQHHQINQSEFSWIYCFIDKSTIPFIILHYFILFMHNIHINFYYCNPYFDRLFWWKNKINIFWLKDVKD